MGLLCMIRSMFIVCPFVATVVMYSSICFILNVFPAPLSPQMQTACELPVSLSFCRASSACPHSSN